jgi:DNA-binding transcriptional ArsR family regulator
MKRDIFQALADPTRRAILVLIAAQAMTPNAIAENFPSARQTISKHIKVLTESQLVSQEYSGREIYYHLNAKKMKEAVDWFAPFQKLWDGRFSKLDNLLVTMKKVKSTKK